MNKFTKLFEKCDSEWSIMTVYYTNVDRVGKGNLQLLKEAYLAAIMDFIKNVPPNVMTE